MEKVKTLIIGSGPAGYTAAIYAGRANLQPVLYSGLQPGGQLTTTTIVENFPGFHEGIDANQLMTEMRQQAEVYGADLGMVRIVKADLSCRPFHLEDERGNQIEAETVTSQQVQVQSTWVYLMRRNTVVRVSVHVLLATDSSIASVL